MVFELEPPLDRADNPYMPRHLQDVRPNLDPDDFAVPHILPGFPPHNLGMMDSTPCPLCQSLPQCMMTWRNTSTTYSLEDHEFPSYFTQRGSPPRLFHSHGTCSLPVDGDEMKVCITGLHLYSRGGIQPRKKNP